MKNQYIIFYSWQSDLPNKTNRGFIHDVLEKAVKNIRKTMKIDAAIDRDTANVPGAPEIHTTIFDKISQADLFVADVSIINNKFTMWSKWFNKDKRKTPNPNVLIELGYALSKLGENRIILIQNLSFGSIEELPFDISKKRVIGYSVRVPADKSNVKEEFIAKLENAIESALTFNDELMRKNTANVTFAFGETKDRKPLGQHMVFNNSNFIIKGELAEYEGRKIYIGIGNKFILQRSALLNKQYYQEYFTYRKEVYKFRQIGFCFINNSLFALSDVNIEIVIPNKNGVEVVKKLPQIPKRGGIDAFLLAPPRKNMPVFADNESYLENNSNCYLIGFKCRIIQPSKEFFFIDKYYLGADNSCDIELKVKIVAKELKTPIAIALTVKFVTEAICIDSNDFVDEIEALESND